jgi:hypothetical protein
MTPFKEPIAMTVKHIGEAIRFSEGKMAKVNLFETERMFCDVYGLEPGQEQKVHKHSGADKVYVVLGLRPLEDLMKTIFM